LIYRFAINRRLGLEVQEIIGWVGTGFNQAKTEDCLPEK